MEPPRPIKRRGDVLPIYLLSCRGTHQANATDAYGGRGWCPKTLAFTASGIAWSDWSLLRPACVVPGTKSAVPGPGKSDRASARPSSLPWTVAELRPPWKRRGKGGTLAAGSSERRRPLDRPCTRCPQAQLTSGTDPLHRPEVPCRCRLVYFSDVQPAVQGTLGRNDGDSRRWISKVACSSRSERCAYQWSRAINLKSLSPPDAP